MQWGEYVKESEVPGESITKGLIDRHCLRSYRRHCPRMGRQKLAENYRIPEWKAWFEACRAMQVRKCASPKEAHDPEESAGLGKRKNLCAFTIDDAVKKEPKKTKKSQVDETIETFEVVKGFVQRERDSFRDGKASLGSIEITLGSIADLKKKVQERGDLTCRLNCPICKPKSLRCSILRRHYSK